MYNSGATILHALRSLCAQTRTDWELILLDDGSKDDSARLADSMRDTRIRLLVDGRRLGLAARLNQAIALARGRFVARMDADDIAYPERLERQVAFLETHADVDLIGSAMVVFSGDGEPAGLYEVPTSHAEICARPFSGFYLPHPTWMGRTEWFRKWRYDPACRKAQDQDLLLRAWRSSHYAALPEPLVGYRQDAISIRKSLLGRYYFSRAVLHVSAGEGRLLAGLAAVCLQVAKLAVDMFAISTGTARTMLKHRARPFPNAELDRWRHVWATCVER